ncbi:TonB-dependent receptor [Chitinophagaceae bacterium 26-R-25]|nr:TonB-dependent receptor [Chitinophagaceae bacterium 26-R-25]
MKLTVFLLTAAFLQLSATGKAQKISYSGKNVPLTAVFSSIEKQTGYVFFYNNKDMNSTHPLSIDIHDVSLQEALNACLQDQPLSYVMKGNTIFIKARKIPLTEASLTETIASNLINVKGRVTNEQAQPMSDVTVLIKGTTLGTKTDAQGYFSLSNIEVKATLEFSYIGYATVTYVVASGSKDISITMQPKAGALTEIVTIGYGTQKRSDVTGAVSTLKGSELASAPTPSAADALQGRVSGVMVQKNSGVPSGSDITIRIRGANSLTYGNDPLVIIDGIQGGNLATLNPNDVESVEVLKDASSLSIYGSRGANGVVLVTTKSGKTPKPKVALSSYVSFDKVRKTLPALNATDYATLVNDARSENGLDTLFTTQEINALGNGTNWQNEIFKNGLSQNHTLSVGGLNNGISYFFSGSVLGRDGIVLNTKYNQYNFRSNIRIQASSRVSFGLNAFYSYDIAKNGDYESAIASALQWSPTKPVYDSNGSYTQPGGGVGPVSLYNPVGYAKEIVNDQNNTALNLAPNVEFKLTNDLKFTSQFVYKLNTNFSGYFDNQVVNNGPASNVNGSVTQGKDVSLQNTNVLTYTKKINDHDFKITGVYEIFKDQYRGSTINASGIPVGLGYNGIAFGTTFSPVPNASVLNTAMSSFVGRLNYGYKNKYLFSFSDRYDGASQLADGHKHENFSAVSVGWNLTEEGFMQGIRSVVPELKLRASYGHVGNAAVPAYSSQLLFYPGASANGTPTLNIKQLSNPNLKWEKTAETNFGIDGKLLNRRVDFSIEYYSKLTNDLLMWQTVPAALGVSSVLTNVGSVSNKGIDASIGGTVVSNAKFRWYTNLTINYNQNKILQLDGLSDTLYYSSKADYPGLAGSFVQMTGQPMGTFLGYKFAGVWKQSEISTAALYGAKPGDAKYIDVNKDGKIDKNDIVVIGNAQPKYVFGWNNNLSYKQIEINMFWQGVSGNQLYNQNRIRREAYTSDAFPTSPVIKDHYTVSNQNTDVPAFSGFEYLNESRWVENGSYIRLKNISVAYNFGNDLLRKTKVVTAAKIYASAVNLLTVTHYTGFDPEASVGKDATAAGVDRSLYPSQKSFLIGLNVTF